jgi:glucokinase
MMSEATIIGVDIGGTNIRVGKVRNNHIISLDKRRISSLESEQKVIDEVIESISDAFDDSILGIGLGVPSVVDVDEGIVYNVQNIPSLKEVPLKKILKEKFKVPIYINNDANCFAVGEKYFGNAKELDNFVGLIIGTGLGAGMYIDGKLFLGANCGAGEFGLLPYKDGIFEDYCSGKYFKSKLNTTGEEIYRKAEKNDAGAVDIFKEFGVHVGNAVNAILLSVDPGVIILGGSVSKAYKYFESSMKDVLEKFPYKHSIEKLKIVKSEVEHISVLGAAALYFENYNKSLSRSKVI